MATNDAYLLRQVSDQSCVTCQGYIHSIDQLKADGKVLIGGRILLTASAIGSGTLVKADHEVDISLAQATETVTKRGDVASSFPPGLNEVKVRVYVSWLSSGWTVLAVETAP